MDNNLQLFRTIQQMFEIKLAPLQNQIQQQDQKLDKILKYLGEKQPKNILKPHMQHSKCEACNHKPSDSLDISIKQKSEMKSKSHRYMQDQSTGLSNKSIASAKKANEVEKQNKIHKIHKTKQDIIQHQQKHKQLQIDMKNSQLSQSNKDLFIDYKQTKNKVNASQDKKDIQTLINSINEPSQNSYNLDIKYIKKSFTQNQLNESCNQTTETIKSQQSMAKQQIYKKIVNDLNGMQKPQEQKFQLKISTNIAIELMDYEILQNFQNNIPKLENQYEILQPLFQIFRYIMNHNIEQQNYQQFLEYAQSYLYPQNLNQIQNDLQQIDPNHINFKFVLKIEKIIKNFQKIKDFKIFENVDSLCGVLQFFIIDVCRFLGLIQDVNNKQQSELSFQNYKYKKLQYYQEKIQI